MDRNDIIILMRTRDGASYSAIARHFGVSFTSIRAHFHRWPRRQLPPNPKLWPPEERLLPPRSLNFWSPWLEHWAPNVRAQRKAAAFIPLDADPIYPGSPWELGW